MGSNVNPGDAIWYDNSGVFGSNIIYTSGYSSTLDFDLGLSGSSAFEILSVSFRFGILDATSGINFGLDVYDDASGWKYDGFSSNLAQGSSAFSGLITFDDDWEVTQLRFHDSGSYDVMMDDLTVNDNCGASAVPEPTAALLFGVGMLVSASASRRRR